MIKLLTTLFATTIFCTQTFACLNGESKLLKDGTLLWMDREGNVPYGHNLINEEELKDAVNKFDSLYSVTRDIGYLSDKGLVLILLKNYKAAIEIFNQIEKLYPKRYSTASNLGTAYELLGQNEKALGWITKAVNIDTASHKNSEWIHVNILRAKIKGEAFYNSQFLINTEFGGAITPGTSLSKTELQKLSDALYYQLNERVTFIQPKDKIVAELYFQLGNIAFLLENIEDALEDYGQARIYGYTGHLIESRIKTAKGKAGKFKPNSAEQNSPESNFYLYCALILATIVVSFYIINKRKIKNKN